MFQVIQIKNFRRGLATNSSSTHSVVYQDRNNLLQDLNVFEFNYYDRCTETIAATKKAKLKYILAAIWYNEELVNLLASKYPEMKEFFPLVKKANEERDDEGWAQSFGMYTRGKLDDSNISFAYEYLCHVIDSDDLAIVGGSDELDFVYDITHARQEYPIAEDATFNFDIPKDKSCVYKNGNYYVALGDCDSVARAYYNEDTERRGEDRLPFRHCEGGRLRFSIVENEEIIPEYPELIDLSVTNKCDHGCKFCFMGSTFNGKHADIRELVSFVNGLTHRVEFAIGGGNALLYPHLEELIDAMNRGKHLVNITIKYEDCEKILNDEKLLSLFENKIDGVGISIASHEQVPGAVKFMKKLNGVKEDGSYMRNHRAVYTCFHLIPEYIGADEVLAIRKKVRELNYWVPYLYLGYKTTGRGANCKYHELTKEEVKSIFGNSSCAIDTTFANRYLKYFDDSFDTTLTITLNEGEYSMYVDGVTMNAYRSSHEKDGTPHYVGWDLGKDWNKRRPHLTVEKAFAEIRKENGFKTYEDIKHYWD